MMPAQPILSHPFSTIPALAPPSSFSLFSGPLTGDWTKGCRVKVAHRSSFQRCNVIWDRNGEEATAVLRDDRRRKTVECEEGTQWWSDEAEYIGAIESMLASMEDGDITPSAYDTAWVALVENLNGGRGPQFPASVQWIANNQLADGSWGDELLFSAHDRILNTLACVVALTKWEIHAEKCALGMSFLNNNINKAEHEKTEHMPIGFEVAFPSLMDKARELGIVVPTSSSFSESINDKRAMKLKRIPRETIHQVATTLLHSLEGVPGLDWERLLELQCEDGSFLYSPSSTACALMHTRDSNSLRYLTKISEKFNGAVPNVYPVDLFERLWVVDRLQRLGIARHFRPQIKNCVDYVHKYWTDSGICWARNSPVHDIDDTSMAFRLLRLRGHDVSADVFRHFNAGDEFFCFAGQCTQGLTGMYNLLRASQLSFPGEDILQRARSFASKFLREKQASNQIFDKWIIQKDLPGEVAYALSFPWYASLPRVETRLYIDQYGGNDDVWIGKTLYRMPLVCNDIYLKLAMLDYDKCQRVHKLEWDKVQEWFARLNLGGFGPSRKSLLKAYFLAAASIFEPERSTERIAWAQTAVLTEAIASYFQEQNDDNTNRREIFVEEFKNVAANRYHRLLDGEASDKLLQALVITLNQLSLDCLVAHERDISHHLSRAWEIWMQECPEESQTPPGETELIARTIYLTAGHQIKDDLLDHPAYKSLSVLANGICTQLRQLQRQKEHNGSGKFSTANPRIEFDMQRLVQIVFRSCSDDVDRNIKEAFLTVVKTYYYSTFSHSDVIEAHINKVLFE